MPLRVLDADGLALDRFHGVVRFEDDRELEIVCEAGQGQSAVPDGSFADVSCSGNVVHVPVFLYAYVDVHLER